VSPQFENLLRCVEEIEASSAHGRGEREEEEDLNVAFENPPRGFPLNFKLSVV